MLEFLWHLATWFGEFVDVVIIVVGIVLLLASFATRVASIVGVATPAGILAGPIGAVIRYVGIVLIVVGGCRLYVARQIAAHDAAFAAKQTAVVDAALAAAAERGANSAAEHARAQAAQELATTQAKLVIANAATVPACRDTPVFRAVTAELRRRAGAGPGAATITK